MHAAANHLPINHQALGMDFQHELAYLTEEYGIPKQLVINFDQTGVHLTPTGAGDHTYEEKGSKHVHTAGRGEKRMITAVMGCTAAGGMLPTQVIFKGKQQRSLPCAAVQESAKAAKWVLSLNPANHWASLETMKEYVTKILVPYRKQCIRDASHLKADQIDSAALCQGGHSLSAFQCSNLACVQQPSNNTWDSKMPLPRRDAAQRD
jgi:hypothetical protein